MGFKSIFSSIFSNRLFAVSRLAETETQTVKELLNSESIIKIFSGANFFGEESSGPLQIRGNGTLALTDQRLFFRLWMPQQDISIRRSSIEAIEEGTSFLGKSYFQPLLIIRYTLPDGKTNRAAWLVPDLREWQRLLTPQGNAELM